MDFVREDWGIYVISLLLCTSFGFARDLPGEGNQKGITLRSIRPFRPIEIFVLQMRVLSRFRVFQPLSSDSKTIRDSKHGPYLDL